VRSRPLFARHAPIRRLRHALRHGLVVPFVVATGLAVLGHQMAATPPATAPRPAAVAAKSPAKPVAAPRAIGLSAELLRGRATLPAPRTAAPRASRSRVRTTPAGLWVRPARGPITSPFGYRWGKLHKGLDFGAPYGSPIYAASAGVVIYAGPEGGYGRLVLVRHAGGIVTAYGHMSAYHCHVGQRVNAGDVIAYVGSEGHSTGPHLHFEVRPGGGAAIDPRPFLRKHGVRV